MSDEYVVLLSVCQWRVKTEGSQQALWLPGYRTSEPESSLGIGGWDHGTGTVRTWLELSPGSNPMSPCYSCALEQVVSFMSFWNISICSNLLPSCCAVLLFMMNVTSHLYVVDGIFPVICLCPWRGEQLCLWSCKVWNKITQMVKMFALSVTCLPTDHAAKEVSKEDFLCWKHWLKGLNPVGSTSVLQFGLCLPLCLSI